MPVTADQLYDKLEEVEKNAKDAVEKIEESQNKWYNKFFGPLVRLLTIVLFGAMLYCAVVGLAASAFVLGLVFLLTWGMYVFQVIAIAIAKGMYEHAVETQKSQVKSRLRL